MKESVSGKAATPPAGFPLALWITLLALLLVRVAAAMIPGRWLWGIDQLRDLPAWTWVLWVMAAATLAPPVATLLGARARGLARVVERPLPLLALCLAGALLVLLIPDRVHFLGDFLLRQGASEEVTPSPELFPQALPLDLTIHVTFPVWATENLHWSANATSRGIDAVEAAILVLLAVWFARRVAPRGPGMLSTAAIVWWGGWLALLTGYSKAFSEIVLLLLAAAVFGLDALRGRPRGYLSLCLVVAAALAFHRSAVGFLPALGFVSWHVLRHKAAPEPGAKRSKRPSSAAPAWLPLLFPTVALAIVLPKILMSATKLDTRHFTSPGEGPGVILSHVVAPLHLLDLLNVALIMVPLVPLLFLRTPQAPARATKERREWILLVVLGLPFWALGLAIRPAQGLVRDFDVFAFAGMTLAIVIALRWARGWAAFPEMARWSPAVIAGTAVPVLGVLLVSTDVDRGLARVHALAEGPPIRNYVELAKMREFLGGRLIRLGRFKESTYEYGKAVELAPSPNTLAAWGMAAQNAGDVASEERAFITLLQRAPEDRVAIRVVAFTGLARIQFEHGDKGKARELLTAALTLDPSDPDANALAKRIANGGP